MRACVCLSNWVRACASAQAHECACKCECAQVRVCVRAQVLVCVRAQVRVCVGAQVRVCATASVRACSAGQSHLEEELKKSFMRGVCQVRLPGTRAGTRGTHGAHSLHSPQCSEHCLALCAQSKGRRAEASGVSPCSPETAKQRNGPKGTAICRGKGGQPGGSWRGVSRRVSAA